MHAPPIIRHHRGHAATDRDRDAAPGHAGRRLHRHHRSCRKLPCADRRGRGDAADLSAPHLGVAHHPGECRSRRADRPHFRARSSRPGRRALDSRRGGAGRHAGACEGHAHRRVAALCRSPAPNSRSAPGRASIWSSTGAGRTAARSCCNSSAAAENKCGAEWAPHATYIARLPITLMPRPAPKILILRVSGIKNRLSTKHTAGTAIG